LDAETNCSELLHYVGRRVQLQVMHFFGSPVMLSNLAKACNPASQPLSPPILLFLGQHDPIPAFRESPNYIRADLSRLRDIENEYAANV
jgi:hypothetical protein